MKIALCLYGQPRSLEKGLSNLKEFVIGPNHIEDIFIHTWYEPVDTPFHSSQTDNQGKWGSYQKDSIQRLLDLKPKKLLVEPPRIYPSVSHLTVDSAVTPQYLASCFDTMRQATLLAGDDYDAIIRIRSDLKYTAGPVMVDECLPNTVYVPKEYQVNSRPIKGEAGIEYTVLTDVLMYGTPATMKKMGEMVDNLAEINPKLQRDHKHGEHYSGYWATAINHFEIKTRTFSFELFR